MADAPRESGPPEREPNLELPSLRLGRRRRKKAAPEPVEAPPAAESSEDPGAAEAPEAAHEPVPEARPERVAEPVAAPVESAPAPEPAVEAVAAPVAEQRIPPPPVLEQPPTTPVAQPEREPEPAALVADEAEPVASAVPQAARRTRRPVGLPRVPAGVAATLTGVVCGLAAVGLAALASHGCSVVRGVGGCGSFGLVALVAILAIEVLLGAGLLRLAGLGDTTSTSFLAVGLVAVLAMLFFLDEIDSPWMLLVIPVLSAAAFWLSWWVTAHFVDEVAD